jgi:hypothetical protein
VPLTFQKKRAAAVPVGGGTPDGKKNQFTIEIKISVAEVSR